MSIAPHMSIAGRIASIAVVGRSPRLLENRLDCWKILRISSIILDDHLDYWKIALTIMVAIILKEMAHHNFFHALIKRTGEKFPPYNHVYLFLTMTGVHEREHLCRLHISRFKMMATAVQIPG